MDVAQSFDQLLLSPPHAFVLKWTREIDSATLAEGGVSTRRRKYPALPELSLECDHPNCDGMRIFDGEWIFPTSYSGQHPIAAFSEDTRTIVYRCRNCQTTAVRFSIVLVPGEDSDLDQASTINITKYGQHPPFRPRISRRVQRFVTGEHWALYLNARRCETHALGIGALTYYRRVVEGLWTKLIDKLVDVAEKTDETKVAAELQSAKQNWRFSAAVKSVSVAVPARLMIGSSNPLTLLHNAFSAGVHELSDTACLQHAADGRRVLEELLERIHQVLQDDMELSDAVGRLAGLKKSRDGSSEDPAPPNSEGDLGNQDAAKTKKERLDS